MNAADALAAEACEAFYHRELATGWCHCLSPMDDVYGNLASQV